jgi:hypothetical protein
MTETYENARDNSDIIPQDTRVKWIEADQADQAERMLRYQYDRLAEDGDLTDEARARRAGELYERHGERIMRKKREAREALVKAAKSAEKSSIPRPQGEALSSTDPTNLVADQNEAARIVRTVKRHPRRPGRKGGR